MSDDLISRQAAIDEINKYILSFDAMDANFLDGLRTAIKIIKENFPSAQTELITVNIDHELTQEEYEKLRKDMANAPIMLLPSAQQWIPCSEKLPEKSGRYLVTNTRLGAFEVTWNIFYNGKGEAPEGWLYEDGTIAWMPLPPSFKEE